LFCSFFILFLFFVLFKIEMVRPDLTNSNTIASRFERGEKREDLFFDFCIFYSRFLIPFFSFRLVWFGFSTFSLLFCFVFVSIWQRDLPSRPGQTDDLDLLLLSSLLLSIFILDSVLVSPTVTKRRLMRFSCSLCLVNDSVITRLCFVLF